MSPRFVNIDRATPMLLPPDLRDWVEDDALVHLVIETVEGGDLSAARVNARGSGSEQYPPAMMLALLIYCYATGRFSSRGIEAASFRDVSVRYLCAGTHPDHDTIATFRRGNGALLRAAFVQVLEVAREMGLLQMGAVALDGTKLRASAGAGATWNARRIEAEQKRLEALEAEVAGLLQKAESADAAAADDGTRLPRQLARAAERRARLELARLRLAERREAVESARRAQREEALACKKENPQAPGDAPSPGACEASAALTVNLTDPQSAMMRERGGGHAHGYNAQAVIEAGEGSVGLILAARVCAEASDTHQLAPTLAAIPAALGTPAAVLVDSGYDHMRAIWSIERVPGAPQIYCAPRRLRRAEDAPARPGRAVTHAAREALAARVRTPEGRRLYARRKMTIEPAFGIIKSVLGFRRFSLRGLEKVNLEWTLVTLGFNCRRLAARPRAPRPAQ